MSLKKTLASFDIDTFGWYDEIPYVWAEKDSKENPTLTNIRNFSQELWGLYIKNKVSFKFANYEEMYGDSVHNAFLMFNDAATIIPHETHRELLFNYYKELIIRGHTNHANVEITGFASSYNLRAKSTSWTEEELEAWVQREIPKRIKERQELLKSETDTVTLGNYLLRNPDEEFEADVPFQRFDNYTYTDAITAIGLQTLETKGICMNIGTEGVAKYITHVNNINATVVLNPGYRNEPAVVSECTLELWYGMCQHHARAKILNSWPGWADIFEADDETFGPEQPEMARYVKNSSPHNSELRRFVRGLLWNLRMPKDEHVNLIPNKGFQPAYDLAKEWWPVITAASFDNATHFATLTDFMQDMQSVLSTKEKIRDKKDKTPNPIDPAGHGIKVDPRPGNKYLPDKESKKISHNEGNRINVLPQKVSTEKDKQLEEVGLTIFTKPTIWSSISTIHLDPELNFKGNGESLDDYMTTSLLAQQRSRNKISEMVSGATWFVPLPPPADHGQLQGQLDEGSLSNFAAFGDPHIFSAPPEQGRGHIAIGIVVDASGSMGYKRRDFNYNSNEYIWNDYNIMQEICSFLGGFRDAISRSVNITMDAYAYHADRTIHVAENPNIHFEDGEYQSWLSAKDDKGNQTNRWSAPHTCCVMRPLNTDDDLLFTGPDGSTPTAEAISAIESRLRQQHPDATRFILVLTDGAPNDIPAVRTVVSSLETPVFCVGINTSSEALKGQYNPGHYFLIDTPEQVAQIACDLVQGIGQALNNA